jgi:hypothetical protein
MSKVDFGALIEEAIIRFSQNRLVSKPSILAKIPPDLPHVFWPDERLEKLLRVLLYEALLANAPDTAIRVMVHKRTTLKDLEEFLSVKPL